MVPWFPPYLLWCRSLAVYWVGLLGHPPPCGVELVGFAGFPPPLSLWWRWWSALGCPSRHCGEELVGFIGILPPIVQQGGGIRSVPPPPSGVEVVGFIESPLWLGWWWGSLGSPLPSSGVEVVGLIKFKA